MIAWLSRLSHDVSVALRLRRRVLALRVEPFGLDCFATNAR